MKKAGLHLLFWVGVWFFYVYFFGYNSNDRVYIFWFSGALLPVTMLVTYVVAYKLIPGYLLQKKYIKFALYTFYVLVFASYMVVLIIYASLIVILKSQVQAMPPMAKNFVFILILILLVVGVVCGFKLLKHNFQTLSRNKALHNKILGTQLQLKEQELNYLKMQIHPHFLFNTLNTIYGFALKQDKQTPDVILKLSNLLDYILYQVSKPRVLLAEELSHIQAYVELERIRFEEHLKVDFQCPAFDKRFVIAPMLLLPFVENAFKHGGLVHGFLQVKIKAVQQDQGLFFTVSNTTGDPTKKRRKQGIGLENIEKRLALHYPQMHELTIKPGEGWFHVALHIYELKPVKDA